MRWGISITMAFALICVGGCVRFEGACESDADCGQGGFCSPESKRCLEDEPRDAGGDAGTDGGQTCAPACVEHRECVETTCMDRNSGVTLLAPASAAFKPGTAVTVRANLQRMPGRTANPPQELQAELLAPGGMTTQHALPLAGEEYSGAVQLGSAEGNYQLRVRYEAADLSSGWVELRVDGTPPSFTATLSAPPQRGEATNTNYLDPELGVNAWRRDETVTVLVSSEAPDVDPGSVLARVKFDSGAEEAVELVPVSASECGGSAAYCATATVQLWKPEMNAFRDELRFNMKGKDVAGNESPLATDSATVTRWKWTHTVDVIPLLASPAIGPDGAIYVGSTAGSAVGKLVALTPDGTEKWPPQALGAVTASAAVGEGADPVLYVPVYDGQGRLHALSSADGSTLQSCTFAGGSTIETAPAVSRSQLLGESQSHEIATVMLNGVNLLLTARPTAPTFKCRDIPIGKGAAFPGAVVAKDASLYFADDEVSVHGYVLGSVGGSIKPGWPVELTVVPRSLALVSSALVGSGRGGTTGGLFRIEAAGVSPAWTTTTPSPAWSPAVRSDNSLVVGLNTTSQGLYQIAIGGVAGTGQGHVTTGVIRGTPLLGQGGWLYTTSMDQKLAARRADAPAIPTWEVADLGAIEASPAIDCTRGANGMAVPGRPGVLYAASRTGKLHAFIVDSRGLDTSAPWPKFQRDPRNSGNAGSDLASFACP